MPEVFFAIPGDISAKTGGYIYDWHLIGLLPVFGWDVRHIELPGDFPAPSAASLRRTEELLAVTPSDALLLIDGLAFGAMPAELIDRIDRRIVGLVHHPLAHEAGIAAERAAFLKESERRALTRTVRVIVTSPSTRDLLVREFGVPAEKISVAEPGTDPVPRATPADGPPRLLSVGSVTEHKGFRVLIQALAEITDLAWESRIIGSTERDKETVAWIREAIARPQLEERISLRGAVEEHQVDAEFRQATLFVLPSYFEGYGMAFAEAMAHGLPVVACAAGAVPKTVPPEAGILVPPGDPAALARALRDLLTNPQKLQALSDGAWAHGQKLPRWHDTARLVASGLERALKENVA